MITYLNIFMNYFKKLLFLTVIFVLTEEQESEIETTPLMPNRDYLDGAGFFNQSILFQEWK